MVQLRWVNFIQIGQGAVPNEEITLYLAQASGLQTFGQFKQLVGYQIRITATDQDQITVQNPVNAGAISKQACLILKWRPQRLHRIKGGDGLGDAGRG